MERTIQRGRGAHEGRPVGQCQEVDPGEDEVHAEAHKIFLSKRDHALAIVVLSMELSLLYLISNLVDPVEVWTKLENQFQKKTWANKLELRRKLY